MAFTYYTPFVIKAGQVPSSQSNFVALIWPANDTRFKTTGNGGHVQNSSGFDIRPYSDPQLTSALTYELVSGTYSATNGTFMMWVKITAVDGGVVYLGYGDSGLTTDGSDGPNTWSNGFVGVFHFGDGTTLATKNSVDGTTGTASSVTAGSDSTGNYASFVAASNSKIDYGDVFDVVASTAFFSSWIKLTSFGGGGRGRVVDKGFISNGYAFYADSSQPNAMVMENDPDVSFSNTNTVVTATWQHWFASSNGSNCSFFLNASAVGSPAATTAYVANGDSCVIGAATGGGNTRNYDGLIRELRFGTGTRSANWITAEYNNQNAPNTFWTIGMEQSTDLLLGQSVF